MRFRTFVNIVFTFNLIYAVSRSESICGINDEKPINPTITRYTVPLSLVNTASYEGENTLSKMLFHGGFPISFGSGMALSKFVDKSTFQFYAITDRGPAVEGPFKMLGSGLEQFGEYGSRFESDSTVFVAPSFIPTIALIQVNNSEFTQLASIEILDGKTLTPISGLPPSPRKDANSITRNTYAYDQGGAVGELPLNDMFTLAGFDDSGLDPEALVFDESGNAFWIADEYGPFLVKLDATTGEILKKYQPGSGSKDLPQILSKRQPTRGLQGLCMDKSTGLLHGLMQSPIDPLDGEGNSIRAKGLKVKEHSKFVRWMVFDPVSETSHLYALPVDGSVFREAIQGRPSFADVGCIGDGLFVVIMRGSAKDPPHGTLTWLNLVKIPKDATDIANCDESLEISSITGRPEGRCDYQSVVGLTMSKLFDLGSAGWGKRKADGLAVVDKTTIAVISDNDFGVGSLTGISTAGVLLADASVHDCLGFASSGRFLRCTTEEGFAAPPLVMARGSGDFFNSTDLWLLDFKDAISGLFPQISSPECDEDVLDIAHINDHHSHLDAELVEVYVNGSRVRLSIGSIPALVTMFNRLPRNVLRIHAGDALTGTLYYTFFRGGTDAALMKAICFDVFVLGNHEFDDGDQTLKHFLDDLRNSTCNTTVLSANVIPQIGTPLARTSLRDDILPWTVKTFNGIRVALIGLTVRNKTLLSSRPFPTTKILDEFTTAQQAIDDALAHGLRHIVLVSHEGYRTDESMASRLRGVDVIIGGDSHSLLGSSTRADIRSEGPYPTIVQNGDGNNVCIGQAWEFSKTFGRMQVKFDKNGNVLACSGHLTLPLNEIRDAGAQMGPLSNIRVDHFLLETASNTAYNPADSGGQAASLREVTQGLGSGLAYKGQIEGVYFFLAITDRGPVVEGPSAIIESGSMQLQKGLQTQSASAVFLAPSFTPFISLLAMDANGVVLSSSISIKDFTGANVTGLPPPPGGVNNAFLPYAFKYSLGGAVGELPLNEMFTMSSFDDKGLDPEALVFDAKQDLLWIADEYGPFLVKLDATTGVILHKYQPGVGPRDLPQILTKRQPNRGLQGLCMDETTGLLHGLLQSAIDPRDENGRSVRVGGLEVKVHSRFVRWLSFDPVTETSKLYALPVDGPLFVHVPTEDISFADVGCLGDGLFVVSMHGTVENSPSEAFNWLNLVRIPEDATDISKCDEDLEKSSITGEPYGQCNYREVTRLEMLKLLDLASVGWGPWKADGLAVVDKRTIAVISENDFGITPVLIDLKGQPMIDSVTLDLCIVNVSTGVFLRCNAADGMSSPPSVLARTDSSKPRLMMLKFPLAISAVWQTSIAVQLYNQSTMAWYGAGKASSAIIKDLLDHNGGDTLKAEIIEPDSSAVRLVQSFSQPMEVMKKTVIGTVQATLCFIRIPGRSNFNPNTPECAEVTRTQGSVMTQIAADALLSASPRAAIALQNAGGVRQGLSPGPITYDTAYLVMPFTNVLYELEMTGQEVIDTLEDAGHFALTVSSGSYPYAAGLRWCFNLSAPFGFRFSRVQVRAKAVILGMQQSSDDGLTWTDLDPAGTYVVIANEYIAAGRDGYRVPSIVRASGRATNTYLYDTQALINWIIHGGYVGPGRNGIAPPPATGFCHRPPGQCFVDANSPSASGGNTSNSGDEKSTGMALAALWLFAAAAFAWHRLRRKEGMGAKSFQVLEEGAAGGEQ